MKSRSRLFVCLFVCLFSKLFNSVASATCSLFAQFSYEEIYMVAHIYETIDCNQLLSSEVNAISAIKKSSCALCLVPTCMIFSSTQWNWQIYKFKLSLPHT